LASAGPRCGPGHRVARQRLEGREQAWSLGARAEGGGVSVGLALGGRKYECARVGVADVAICASASSSAFCASQTSRTRNGPGRATSATLVTPGTGANANLTTPCIPRSSNACMGASRCFSPAAWVRHPPSLSPCWPISRTRVSDQYSETVGPGQ